MLLLLVAVAVAHTSYAQYYSWGADPARFKWMEAKGERASVIYPQHTQRIGQTTLYMIDRIRLGYVVDFIDVYCFDFWYYIFNVADMLVCVGAGMMFLAVILEWCAETRKKKEKENANNDLH